MIPPVLLFLLRIAFDIQDLLFFHINFRIDFSISAKNDIEILMDITMNLEIVFGSVAIFMLLIWSIYEHGRSFYFLVSSSVSFVKVL
jgi:hypothetical protein